MKIDHTCDNMTFNIFTNIFYSLFTRLIRVISLQNLILKLAHTEKISKNVEQDRSRMSDLSN